MISASGSAVSRTKADRLAFPCVELVIDDLTDTAKSSGVLVAWLIESRCRQTTRAKSSTTDEKSSSLSTCRTAALAKMASIAVGDSTRSKVDRTMTVTGAFSINR